MPAEFKDYLRCGRLEYEFMRVKCDSCRHEQARPTRPNELADGLARQGVRLLYPVEDGIPVMLVEESIAL